MVEYTDPNPFKEFHVGHLMSNAIGESIARLLEVSGAKVIRANYQGDVGPHVAKALWGKRQKPERSWGEAYTYGTQEYESKKTEIDEINKKVYEKSDAQINTLYDTGRKESLKRFDEIYKILGTKFDYYFFESETSPKDLGLLQLKKDTESMDESITVTANEQSDYFSVVLVAAKKVPEITDIAEKTKHVSHGMMRVADSKMSSRTGNVITGESLLQDLTK